MKPTDSPTRSQPNPRKVRLKVAFGPPFPTANIFSWVGIDFRKQTTRNPTQPNSPQTPYFFCVGLCWYVVFPFGDVISFGRVVTQGRIR